MGRQLVEHQQADGEPDPLQRDAGLPVREKVMTPGPAERNPLQFARRRRRQERALSAAVPIAFLALWQVTSSRDWLDSRFFPPPTRVVSTGIDMVRDGAIQSAVLTSARALVVGYVAGAILGLLIGAATGASRWFRVALEPLLSALYTVPKLAIFPLLLLIFGLGDTSKIVLILISVYFYVWISTMSGIMAVEKGYIEAAESFGASRIQMFRHVLFPGALPQVFVGLRLGAGVAVLVMVAAEFVSGRDGIGYLIWHSWQLLIASRMYVGIVTVALMGVLAMELVKAVGRRLMPWDQNTLNSKIRGG